MIDINIIRKDPDLVRQNLINKFQEEKLSKVDEVLELDEKHRLLKVEGDTLRAKKNIISSDIGMLAREKQLDKIAPLKEEVGRINQRLKDLEEEEALLGEKIKSIMMIIPNIIDNSVPIGKDDSENVEIEKFGTPRTLDFEVPYHADILNSINGLDKESAGRTSGTGFYYLMGDAARLHEAMIAYGRDYMIDNGFTYCIPPFMIRSDVVNGVMSFNEMESMM